MPVPGIPWRAPTLEKLARRHLALVGDGSKEFVQTTPKAFHLRRRLKPEEEAVIGPVVDVRGTPEALRRFLLMRDVILLSPMAKRVAALELSELANGQIA
jgi:hypothetical protein